MGMPQGWIGCFGQPDLQMGYGYSYASSRWGTGIDCTEFPLGYEHT